MIIFSAKKILRELVSIRLTLKEIAKDRFPLGKVKMILNRRLEMQEDTEYKERKGLHI